MSMAGGGAGSSPSSPAAAASAGAPPSPGRAHSMGVPAGARSFSTTTPVTRSLRPGTPDPTAGTQREALSKRTKRAWPGAMRAGLSSL